MDNSSNTYSPKKENAKSKSLFRLRSDRVIFFICILIASLFWSLIKLSGVYSTNYTFRVKYNNVPPDLRLTKIIDSTLDLSVTARGFSILKMNLFDDMENLDINLNNYSIEHREGVKYEIYTQELTSKLAKIIDVSENDFRLSKAMLSFEMEKTSEKKILVVPDYSINFVNQYDLYSDVKSDLEFIIVYGPEKVLDTLTTITTKKLILENISSDQVVKVGLENPNPRLLSFNQSEVTLNFEVEKFTESEITLPVNLNNLKYEIKTFPSQVKVFYRVAQSDFNKVQANQFTIYPVVNNMNIQQAHKLPLRLSKQPDFVRNLRIVPFEVEFLIIK